VGGVQAASACFIGALGNYRHKQTFNNGHNTSIPTLQMPLLPRLCRRCVA
jgi:hypothetical protein